MNVLNVYQINIFYILTCMPEVKHNSNPWYFANAFKKIQQKYPQDILKAILKNQKTTTKATSFAIFSCGPLIRNNYLEYNEKSVLSLPSFCKKLEIKLLNSENELCFFWYCV